MNVTIFVAWVIVNSVTCKAFENATFEAYARSDAFTLTTPQEHPYAVLVLSLRRGYVNIICSGSLLTEEWVLTAAHCLYGKTNQVKQFLVYAGGSCLSEVVSSSKRSVDAQIRQSDQVVVHPLYYTKSFSSDIGLIKVDHTFTLANSVKPIHIGTHSWINRDLYSSCSFTGFGIVQLNEAHTEDNKRKTQVLSVKQPCNCERPLRKVLGENMARTYLCSRARQDYGLCSGDSGGGLVCDGTLQGVATAIIPGKNLATCQFTSDELVNMKTRPEDYQCGVKDTMSVFLFVYPHLPWLVCHVNLTYVNATCEHPKNSSKKHSGEETRISIYVTILGFILCR